MSNADLVRWQRVTVGTLFVGYAGYYVCRSNLSVAAPLMQNDPALRFSETELGLLQTLGITCYTIGKVTNGITADFLGGRSVFLLGMVASVVCTVLFGIGAGLVTFAVLWMLNRYVQSMGWVALVKTSSRWFPVHRHATIMGVLSMSYLVGDWFARLYLGEAIDRGAGWRGVFFLAAATLAVISLACWFLLKPDPSAVGLDEPRANPVNVYGRRGEDSRPPGFGELIGPFLRNRVFWLICAINFGLTMLRETFNFWNPLFLANVVGQTEGDAAKASSWFPLVGGAAALVAGVLSDRLGGRHGRVVVPSIVMLIATLFVLWTLPLAGRPVVAVLLICAVAFFLLGPYSFLSGVMALDLGGKQGASTAAGLIDSAGYAGAILSGVGVGLVAENWGWSAVFACLLAVGVLSGAVSIVYLMVHEREHKRTREVHGRG